MVGPAGTCEFGGVARQRLLFVLRLLKRAILIDDLLLQALPRCVQLLGQAGDPRKLGLCKITLALQQFLHCVPIALRPPQAEKVRQETRLAILMLRECVETLLECHVGRAAFLCIQAGELACHIG
ncbi:hypothetical protein D3C81_1531630 [compost metagenome]